MKKVVLVILSFIFLSLLGTFSPKVAFAACTAGMPGNLMVKAGTMPGTAMLNWNPATSANRYALVYGLMPNSYMFGALAIDGGMQTNYTVTMLNPGTKYYFQVWAFCDDAGPATPSSEVSLIAP